MSAFVTVVLKQDVERSPGRFRKAGTTWNVTLDKARELEKAGIAEIRGSYNVRAGAIVLNNEEEE